ncbi:glycosyltransferase family 4 protein [Rossellomorea sp. NRS-1567]|uniref:glycosyltransferase family 4 protein n=1 Tax=Rossellomorea sp. NRS-1567 TaxID=3233901 RepID=UPI003D2A4655
MKIWMLNAVALKPNETGITRHYDLSKHMVDKGHEVTIFASSFIVYLFKWRDNKKKNYSENVNGVLFEWVWTLPYKGNGPKRLLNMMSYMLTAVARGLKKKDKPDVIVGSSVHLFACLAAYVLSKVKGATFIVEIRDLWPKTLIDFGAISKNHPLALLFGWIEKFVYKKSKKIIVTLPGAYKYITTLGIPEDKIVYIPNGIEMDKIHELENKASLEPTLQTIREQYPKIAMYLGSHGVANSLETIVNAANRLSREDTAFVFVGEGPEKKNLKVKAEELGLKNVFFLDGIPKREVLSTLNLADVLMVSMLDTNLYQYGISLNKLNDYLLSGKPIIFSGRVFNDIVADAQAGITVTPESPEEFAKGMEYLLNLTSEEKEKIRTNGYRYLDEHHNIEKLSSQFLSVCKNNHFENKENAQ